MDSDKSRIIIGRFGKVHGIRGFVTVHSFTDPIDNILKYLDVISMFHHNVWQPVHITAIEARNKIFIAQVDGFPTREAVAELTHADLAIPKELLESLSQGEYYWHELIGMNVINTQKQSLGQVVELLPTGANDVLIVQGEKRHLIPYLPGQFVLEINKAANEITVEWDIDF